VVTYSVAQGKGQCAATVTEYILLGFVLGFVEETKHRRRATEQSTYAWG